MLDPLLQCVRVSINYNYTFLLSTRFFSGTSGNFLFFLGGLDILFLYRLGCVAKFLNVGIREKIKMATPLLGSLLSLLCQSVPTIFKFQV